MIRTEIFCPIHPRYTAVRKPTGKCTFCENLWELARGIRWWMEREQSAPLPPYGQTRLID